VHAKRVGVHAAHLILRVRRYKSGPVYGSQTPVALTFSVHGLSVSYSENIRYYILLSNNAQRVFRALLIIDYVACVDSASNEPRIRELHLSWIQIAQ
jgi:hypothetical protein